MDSPKPKAVATVQLENDRVNANGHEFVFVEMEIK